LAHLSV